MLYCSAPKMYCPWAVSTFWIEKYGAPASPSSPRSNCIVPTSNRLIIWLWNMGPNTSLIRQGWCFWQHLPASYSPYTICGSCSQRHGLTSSWLTAAAVSADSEKSASTLRSRGKDGCITRHLQSTQNVNPRSAHRVKAPSRTPSPHVATYPGRRSPAS